MAKGKYLDYQYSWRKEHIKRCNFDLNKDTEEDVYKWLEKQPNKRAYLIDLIRKDMKKNGKEKI